MNDTHVLVDLRTHALSFSLIASHSYRPDALSLAMIASSGTFVGEVMQGIKILSVSIGAGGPPDSRIELFITS